MWKCKKCGCVRFNIWFRGYMEADFEKHIKKLENYKNGKYRR